MSDYVSKLIPYEGCEPDALEGWLEDMAKKGFLLERISLFSARFKKVRACNTRFRLDPSQGGNLKRNSERRLQLKEMGWEYVDLLYGSTLYKTDDQNIELPSPPEKVSKAKWQAYGAMLSPIIILLFFVVKPYLDGNSPLSTDLQDIIQSRGLYLMLAFIFMAITLFGSVFINAIAALQLRHREKRGEYPNHSFHSEQREKRRTVAKAIITATLLSVFLCVALALSSFLNQDIPLAKYGGTFPFPLLSEINADEGQEVSSGIQSGELDANIFSFLMKDSNLLAPRILMTRQIGPTALSSEGYYQSKFAYDVNYFELSSASLANKLFADLENDHLYQPITSLPGVQAMYVRNVEEQNLLMKYKNIVIYVWYDGSTDLCDCIPLYEAHIKQQGN